MEDSEAFLHDLNGKLHQYLQELDKNLFPALKTEFSNFHSMMGTVMKILLKKGILIQDPYKYDEMFNEVVPISAEPFGDNERMNEMSVRLSKFMSQLDFINNYYQFSIDYINFQRIKALAAFIRFIVWDSLSMNHKEVVQRAMTSFISKAQAPDDPLTSGLIKDAANQLAIIQKKILELIKRISVYKREEYKHLLRSTIGHVFKNARLENENDPEAVARTVRKEFVTHLKGEIFIPELVKEIFAEDTPGLGENLRRDLLQKLTVKVEKKNKEKKVIDFKAQLLDTLRNLSNVGVPLEAAFKKLTENSIVLENRRMSFGEHFNQWIKSILGQKREPLIYNVEMLDPQTAVVRPEKIDFDKFQKDGFAKIKNLESIGLKTSNFYLKLSSRPEKEILEFINTNFLEVSRMVEKINALDVYFKSEVPKEKKNLIRGTKVEVMQIRSMLSATNKSKLEYMSAVEEIEQLKRLGVKIEE